MLRAMILEESSVELSTSTGPMRTYVYRPKAPGRRAGVLLFSEIFQRTGPIGRMAAMLAGTVLGGEAEAAPASAAVRQDNRTEHGPRPSADTWSYPRERG